MIKPQNNLYSALFCFFQLNWLCGEKKHPSFLLYFAYKELDSPCHFWKWSLAMVLVFQGFSLGITFLLIFQSAYLNILTDADFMFCFLDI